jgi:hypothetical protein
MMRCTTYINSRIDNVVTVSVQFSRIVDITQAGYSTNVPRDGFAIIMPEHLFARRAYHWELGDVLTYEINSNLIVENIQTAIGGGRILMENGVDTGATSGSLTGRHPRTAVGLTDDERLILMTVDGRTHSVGATRGELVWLLQKYGVVDAMSLDGGGSTTMVTRSDAGTFATVNTPSDGNPRRVINALGVFNTAPIGAIISPEIELPQHIVAHLPAEINVFGRDAHRNRIPLASPENVIFTAQQDRGFWHYGRYVPLAAGTHTISARFTENDAEMEISATFDVLEPAQIAPSVSRIHAISGSDTRVRFSLMTTCGRTLNDIHPTSVSIHPAGLGYFRPSGHFRAVAPGTGYLAAVVGNVRAYIPLYVVAFPYHFLPENADMSQSEALSYVRNHVGYRALFANAASATAPRDTVFRDPLWLAPNAPSAAGRSYIFAVPIVPVQYSALELGNFAVITLSAYGGGISRADAHQWARLTGDIRDLARPYTIILMDYNPLRFAQREESRLLRDALTLLADEGHTIFVVSPSQAATAVQIRDGVRYITTNAAALRFYVSDTGIRWGCRDF